MDKRLMIFSFSVIFFLSCARISSRFSKNVEETKEVKSMEYASDEGKEDFFHESQNLWVDSGTKEVASEDDEIDEFLALGDSEEKSFEEPKDVVGEPMGMDGEYVVKKGDTLMLVAFHLYGDYKKWRDLSKMNLLNSSGSLDVGSVIKYSMANSKPSVQPDGLPYLVRRGDTLMSISYDKYKTSRRWKDIWENNKSMIIDPNLIFAGFTLYYIPDRELASEKNR